MITSWYIIYWNFGGHHLAIVDAINEAEAHKILNQSVVVISIDRTENMHQVLPVADKKQMIDSFNEAKKQNPKWPYQQQ